METQLKQIAARCKSGDRSAYKALFERFHPRLKYYVRRLDSDKADDHLQEIWMAVLQKMHTLKKPESFSIWLYRIARNQVYSGFRAKERTVRLPEDQDIPVSDNHDPGFRAETAEKLHQALNELKAPHREVLTLSFMEQMPYQAIAQVTGCSIGTVRSRLYHAKKALREKMERQNG